MERRSTAVRAIALAARKAQNRREDAQRAAAYQYIVDSFECLFGPYRYPHVDDED